MKTLCWVIGRGLLGSHMHAALRQRPGAAMFASPRLPWGDAGELKNVMQRSVADFAAQAQRYERWTVAWCAGIGVMSTPEAELVGETGYWKEFLTILGSAVAAHARPGAVFLASSAGAVYGGGEQVIDETTPASPSSAYGRQKLAQEELLRDWIAGQPGVQALIGRLSTLYGPGQNLRKQQGLISHISRSVLRHQPVSVYVPLDTIRDYLYAGDCAEALAEALETLMASGERCVTKIFASQQVTAIAQLVAVFKSLAKTNPRIVQARQPLAANYPRAVCFRSRVWPHIRAHRTCLADGIARLHRYQLERYASGS